MIAELAPFLLLVYLGVEMILIATQHKGKRGKK